MTANPYEPRFPQYEKRAYPKVFQVPGPNWKLEAVWDDAYYHSAKRLIEGVVCGEYLPAFEGVAGLFCFRHYLELALKFIIFHSHWLKDAETNAKLDDIEDVKNGHSLGRLWTLAKTECQRIIPAEEWDALDVHFVDECVLEFDAIDPSGECFRYHGPHFGVEKDAAKRVQMGRTMRYDLYVRFSELMGVIEHLHDVLDYLDMYMVEAYGDNEEWESYLNSL